MQLKLLMEEGKSMRAPRRGLDLEFGIEGYLGLDKGPWPLQEFAPATMRIHNVELPLEFRWEIRWSQEQTPATAYI